MVTFSAFNDVDLSTDLISLAPLIGKIRDGDDIAVGSRFLPENEVRSTGDRKAASTGFNRLVRMFLASRASVTTSADLRHSTAIGGHN